jgi:GNAT superfamily N-acetyltransferase
MGPDGDLVAARFARGCRCFAVWIDGGLGGYGWLSTGPEWIGELQLEIKPRPGEAYIWNCATVEERRRQGIFRSLLVGISDTARKEGLKRLWIGSVAIPAEKAVEPSGFKPALRFTSLTFGGLHMMRVTPASDTALAREAISRVGTNAGVRLRRSRVRRH